MADPLFGDPRLPESFWDKVSVADSGCWNWHGYIDKAGYCRVRHDGRTIGAYRRAYTALIAEIAKGLVCDHLCRNRWCCNPAHIEPVTNLENIMRGECYLSSKKRSARTTHCPKGHEYTDKNTRTDPRGYRSCKACHNHRMMIVRRVARRARGAQIRIQSGGKKK